MSNDLDDYWNELVTTALLGTDRREPPAPPAGPVADLIADAVRPDDASRMLTAVAAARRAAFAAGPPAGRLQLPESDGRSCCSAAAVATWRTAVAEWPVLEDEWVLTVIQRGLRVPPDALVEQLQRHRGDAVRRARVAVAGGPLAAWLVDHLPSLAAATRGTASAEAVANLPELPVPPDLAHLLTADAHTFVKRLAQGFDTGEYGPPHRAVLVNLFARCRPEVLLHAAATLGTARSGLALALADLAGLRHRMLSELGVVT
jgi:hypothetical protein